MLFVFSLAAALVDRLRGEDPGADHVRRVARGDTDALRTLFDRFGRRVLAVCRQITGDGAEAEDLLQETMVEVWRRAPQFDPERGTVVSWVLAIARSRALNRLDSRVRAAKRAEAAGADVHATRSLSPLVAAEGREQWDRLRTALAELPEDQRALVELAYFEGLSHSQIAARTETALGTVKTRIRLGLQKLSSALRAEEER